MRKYFAVILIDELPMISSSLDVQLWQYGLLSSPRVILLDKTAPGCMVPIALASIPISPWDKDNSGQLWASKPQYHVSIFEIIK